MKSTLKNYLLVFEDKEGNELQRTTCGLNNIKEARDYAKKIHALSMINDLHKIRVRRVI